MATTADETTTKLLAAPDGDQRVVLRAVGWEGYKALRRLRGSRNRPKLVYLDGDVFLMSPAFRHERLVERLGGVVAVLTEELDIPCVAAGQTTFRRRKKDGGVEGEKTLYLANEAQVRGKDTLHLRHDPPPDPVIEVENTHDADAALEVWRRFEVPEVWVVGVDRLTVLALRPDGDYEEAPNSRSFPWLSAPEIHEQLARDPSGLDNDWLPPLRRWLAEVVAPRRQNDQGGA